MCIRKSAPRNYCDQQTPPIISPDLTASQILPSSQPPGQVTTASWLFQGQKRYGNQLVWETQKETIACDALGRCWASQPPSSAGYSAEPGAPRAGLIRGYFNQR